MVVLVVDLFSDSLESDDDKLVLFLIVDDASLFLFFFLLDDDDERLNGDLPLRLVFAFSVSAEKIV
jgi:hypothetical protein